MNKKAIIKRLHEGLGYDEDKCISIVKILEDTFVIGKKSKKKMIDGFMSELGIDEEQADEVYNSVIEIIGSGIKERIIHPFKDMD